MFCPSCGNKLEDNSKFCPSCGKKIEEKNSVQDNKIVSNNNVSTSKTNGFAVAGFIISLASMLLCCGTLSWLSLIFSIIGTVNANKENGNGKGLAIAGIVISAISLVLYIVLYILGVTSSVINEVEKGGVGTIS